MASVTSNSVWPYGLWPARLLCPWDSAGKNAGVGSHGPSRGFSQPRDWTCVSYISCTATLVPPGKPLKCVYRKILSQSFATSNKTTVMSELCRWLRGELSACQCSRPRRRGFDPWVRKIPWSRKWQPIPIFLPGKFHGQRSLAGYSPWGHKESDKTENPHKNVKGKHVSFILPLLALTVYHPRQHFLS